MCVGTLMQQLALQSASISRFGFDECEFSACICRLSLGVRGGGVEWGRGAAQVCCACPLTPTGS